MAAAQPARYRAEAWVGDPALYESPEQYAAVVDAVLACGSDDEMEWLAAMESVTGELDLRTPMPQSEEYFAALKMRGVPAGLLRFDGEYHGTGSRPSNWMRTQLYMMQWYNKWRRTSDRQVTSDQ